MKALKIAAVALVGLLVLIGIGLAVIASRFDPAWARQELAKAVHEKTQRTLKIEGDLSLSFFPSLGVELGRASLSEPNSDREFAALNGAHVSVRLMPLISRQLEVDRIQLDGVRANIVRSKEGSFNFDDLLAKGEPETGKDSGGRAEGAPVRFDVAGIGLKDSALTFRDEKSGRSLRLTGVELKTGRLANAADGPLKLALKVDGEQPRLKAAVDLGADYRYDLDKKQYAVEKLEVKVKGDLAAFEALDAALSARELKLAGDKGGIQVVGLALTAKGQWAGDALEVKVDMPNLALLPDRASGQAATGLVRLAGKQRQLEGKVELSGLEGTSKLFKVGNASVQWSLGQGPLAAGGKVAGGLQGSLDARVVDVPKLTGELELSHPEMPMKQLKLPLDGSIRADWGKSQAAGSLATRLEDSSIRAKWQVPKFSPLAVGFDLAIDRLDMDRYLAKTPTGGPGGGSPAAAKGKEASPIDFSSLRGMDIQGGMRIGSLQARNVKLNNLRADIRLRNGRLDVSPLSADLYGGSLSGAVSAQAEGNRVALRQTLNNVSIGPLLRDLAQKDVLEGRGQIGIDVTASGASVEAMKQALAGSANLKLRDGAIKGINLAKSVRQAKAMVSGGREAVVAADKAEKTDFTELTATFRIADGVARNNDLSAKSPFLRLAGAGNIDLARGRMDYLVKATIVGSAAGQEGRELQDLKGMTIPVGLTGPFDNLSYRLEFGAMAAEAAKQQVRKELEKQNEKKGLGGALKDLLK